MNRWLIEKAKEIEKAKKDLEKATKNNLPELYSCICKVLIDRHGWTADEVAELFEETEDLWNELVENDSIHGMINWCEATTGVALRSADENSD